VLAPPEPDRDALAAEPEPVVPAVIEPQPATASTASTAAPVR
jgi:hypothetical protein